MQYISGRRINQDFGVPGITTNDTVVNVDGRIAVGIGTTATANVDTNTLRVRDTVVDANGFSGELGYFLTKDSDGLIWTEVSPITSNSIFVADNGNILGVSSFTGLNIISDQLLGVTTNTTNPNFADISIDPRWFRDRTPGGGGGIYTTGTVGIGSTQPRLGAFGVLTDVKLDVIGDAIFSGIVSASSFVGEFDVETQDLEVTGIATFSGTEDNILGNVNTGAVQIDGGVGIEKNVSIGQTLQVGSAVTIGNGTVSATTGDFVNLELENLNVSGFSTFGNVARFDNSVNIFDDLFVSGNISVGGTGVTLDTETIRIEGKELLIGFTTTITPNDTTANAAGIAVASTEGKVYIDLQVPGINTAPNTYKQIKWFKSGTLTGLGTDAFISNQPISIATSSIADGQLFTVGDQIQFTETQITAPTFVGNLTGTASTASFATTAFTLDGVVESDLNVASASTASFATTAFNLEDAANITTGTISSDRLTGSYAIDITGNAGTASTASFATTAYNLDGFVESDLNVAFAQTAGIATYTSEWTLGANGTSDFTFTGPGFTGAENDPTLYLTRGQQYKFINNSGGSHPFRIQSTPNGSTGTQYNDGITNNDTSTGTLTWDVQFDAPDILYYQCTSHTSMGGKIYIVNAGIASDVNLYTTGIATIGSVQINAGIITATTGIITYYGDGQYLQNITSSGGGGISSITINNNTLDQSQYLTYAVSTGNTTGLGVTTEGLVFNPFTGRMGIGQTLPQAKLDINVGTGLTALNIEGSEGQLFSITNNLTSGSIFSVSDVSGVPSIDVDADGTIQLAPFGSTEYVGIGTTNPTQKLDVNGNIRLRGALYDNSNGIGATNQVLTSTGSGISWQDAAVSGVGIQSGGTVIGTGITTLNFVGAGSTFAVNGTTVDINIAGGSATPDISPVMMGMIF